MPKLLPALLLAAVCAPAHAYACGACVSPPGPNVIVQKAERILFANDPATKKSTVWVEVKYNGPPQNFGWVVPMPKKPTVGVGSAYLFDRLDQATAPRFAMTVEPTQENCRSVNRSSGFSGCATSDSSALASPNAGGAATGIGNPSNQKGVTVLEQASVGPYDYAILASDKADDLLAWLNGNGFATPQKALPIIDSHLQKKDVFVAFKLSANTGIDAIKPVTFEMVDADPCVPLRLTSVAATEDMDVIVYLAGPGRGIPKNHLHVSVNPLKLSWENAGKNYAQVLSAAIDEAAGRAFVTEYAGPANSLKVEPAPSGFSQVSVQYGKPLDSPGFNQATMQQGSDTGAFATGDLLDPKRLDATPFQTAKTLDDVLAALKKTDLPLSDDVVTTLNKLLPPNSGFTGATWRGVEQGALSLPQSATVVDGPALAKELGEFANSVKAAHALILSTKTLTRLAMRISPTEMTRDPLFTFHPDMPAQGHVLTAKMRNVCSKGDEVADFARLTPPGTDRSYLIRNGNAGNGFSFNAPTAKTALEPVFKNMPAAQLIEVLDESKPPVPVAPEQIELIDVAIGLSVPGVPTLPKDFNVKPAGPRVVLPPSDPPVTFQAATANAKADPGGCASGPESAAARLLGLLAIAALAIGLRRRA